MAIRQIWDEFNKVRDDINSLNVVKHRSVSKTQGLGFFGGRALRAIRLMFLEKELITFALIQWVSVAIGYLLWVQMLAWIPEDVWRSTEHSDEGSIADLILTLWSLICVGIAAFPLALSTACMGAAHFLNRQGQDSSILKCLVIVLPNTWSLWIFHWIDGWITVGRILDRLPDTDQIKNYRERALNEAQYYAWKVGSMGILPSLITGRGVFQACKDSVSLVSEKTSEIILLRAGYSAICWILGIVSYFGSFAFLYFFEVFPKKGDIYGHIFTIYLWLAVPILITVLIIQLFIRPIYILSLCDIYSDYLEERNQEAIMEIPISKGISALFGFLILCLLAAIVYLFRYELGIMDMLATKYGVSYKWE